jgi:hypothetical protein
MGPECRGKRSTSGVGELAEEVGGGALGGVFVSGSGYVSELGSAIILRLRFVNPDIC